MKLPCTHGKVGVHMCLLSPACCSCPSRLGCSPVRFLTVLSTMPMSRSPQGQEDPWAFGQLTSPLLQEAARSVPGLAPELPVGPGAVRWTFLFTLAAAVSCRLHAVGWMELNSSRPGGVYNAAGKAISSASSPSPWSISAPRPAFSITMKQAKWSDVGDVGFIICQMEP